MYEPLPQRRSHLALVAVFLSCCIPTVYGSSDPQIKKKVILAVVVVAVALVLGGLMFLCVYCICKKKRTKNQKYEAVAMRSVSAKHKTSWEIPFSTVILSNESLGEGYFGDIHKCKIKNGLRRTTVAVAYLEGEAQITSRDSFHNELDLMKKIGRHRNIICLVATSYNKNESLYVAFEYANYGDLRAFLRNHRLPSSSANNISSLAVSRLLRFALDVAKGMDYLSSLNIVHKELRARNVLIGNGLIAKVSGIGLSKQQPSRSYKRHGKQMSFRWSAIESWSEKVFTVKSDVWSFGILLWEIATLGGTPYHAVSNSNVLQQRLADGHRLEKPAQCTEEIYNQMLFCWQDSPEDRPTFADLLHDLSRMAEAKDAETQMFVSFKQESGFTHTIIDPDNEDS